MNTAFLFLARESRIFFFSVKGVFTASPSGEGAFRAPMLDDTIPSDMDSVWPYRSVT